MTVSTDKPHAAPREQMSTTDGYRRAIEHLTAERVHALSALELERIQATLAMIPSDVSSALDVGCGDGRLLERLPTSISAVGVEYSYQGSGRLAMRALCASSEHLPFSDSS